MQKYPLVGIVERRVTDIVTITVNADSEEEAYDLARKVLEKFPDPHTYDGVDYCYTERREYRDSELVDLREQEDVGIA